MRLRLTWERRKTPWLEWATARSARDPEHRRWPSYTGEYVMGGCELKSGLCHGRRCKTHILGRWAAVFAQRHIRHPQHRDRWQLPTKKSIKTEGSVLINFQRETGKPTRRKAGRRM